jgi:hypothetical protein
VKKTRLPRIRKISTKGTITSGMISNIPAGMIGTIRTGKEIHILFSSFGVSSVWAKTNENNIIKARKLRVTDRAITQPVSLKISPNNTSFKDPVKTDVKTATPAILD